MYAHYGYQPLPQHQGNHFFTDQIAHLEIAVRESIPTSRNMNHYVPPFETTVPGRTLAFLKSHNDFISFRELGEKVKISRKSAATAVNYLRKMGHKFEEKAEKQLMFVRLKNHA